MFKGRTEIIENREIAKDIFSMTLRAREAADAAKAGQFVNLYLDDKSRLLPRPISICEVDKEAGTLRLVFRIAGDGTKQLSSLKNGDSVTLMGPLGNGFIDTPEKTAILFGGGIGIPPMLGLAEKLNAQGVQVTSVLGYRDSENFLAKEFEKYGKVIIATDDGSAGFHGNVVQAASEAFPKVQGTGDGTCVFACGPLPMLRGVKGFAKDRGMKCQVSMEERMACGVGACLGCVIRTAEVDEHSNVKNKRVCKDGPVFWAEETEL
ncbi:MAG: dihydroorotate dehydrogenase electron transfer subunit [Lachnospiraceae bacterium]|nr:dihydroorotate dehydrogenase electron transfer subunit [Lachnospiraceae bacterium]